MSSDIFERFSIISCFVIALTCNSKKSDSDKKQNTNMDKPAVSTADTIKIDGCLSHVKARLGSVIEIRLEAVPGTGYQWLVKDSSSLLQLQEADNLKFAEPESDKPVPGKPVQQILHFKAMKKGEELIRLEYKRIWEKEILKSCEIKMEID
jgi:predicted secreted protein